MRKSELETLEAVRELAPVTVAEAAEHLGLPLSSARGRLERLRGAGVVERSQREGVREWEYVVRVRCYGCQDTGLRHVPGGSLGAVSPAYGAARLELCSCTRGYPQTRPLPTLPDCPECGSSTGGSRGVPAVQRGPVAVRIVCRRCEWQGPVRVRVDFWHALEAAAGAEA